MRARFLLLPIYLLYWLGFFFTARILFLAWNADRAAALGPGVLGGVLRHGVPLDLASAAWLSLLPFLLVAFSAIRPLERWAGRILLGYTALATLGLALLIAADLGIFPAWGRRIDAAVLQYLPHPRELWASAGGSPRAALLAVFGALGTLFLWIAWRLIRPRLAALPAVHPAGGLPFVVCALLLAVPARGGIVRMPRCQRQGDSRR